MLESRPLPTPPPEWNTLELAVRRLLEAHDALRRRADDAERRVKELEAALGDVSTGALDPLELAARASSLERANRELLERLALANVVVERIATRLNFLEADR